MAKFLVVTWDGGGNLTPALAIARSLAARGHDVRLLGHPSIHGRCESGGWRFRPFAHTAHLDASVAFPSEEEEWAFLVNELLMSPNVARDVAEEIRSEPADVIVADAMLPGALCVGEAAGVPTVALFSTAFSIFRSGPFVDALSPSMGLLNAMRTDLKLPEVAGLSGVHDACSLCVVASPSEFEPVASFPPHVRFVGPLVDAPALMVRDFDARLDQGSGARVVVSFSTCGQRQHEPLQRVVDALADLPVQVLVTTGAAVDPSSVRAPSNALVVDFVRHERVVPGASLVVTHAGMGTIMKAFVYGVPLVCMPMGRDQYFNAGRVEALGVGVTIGIDASLTAIGDTVRRALDDPGLRSNARHLAELAATYEGESEAVALVEALGHC